MSAIGEARGLDREIDAAREEAEKMPPGPDRDAAMDEIELLDRMAHAEWRNAAAEARADAEEDR